MFISDVCFFKTLAKLLAKHLFNRSVEHSGTNLIKNSNIILKLRTGSNLRHLRNLHRI